MSKSETPRRWLDADQLKKQISIKDVLQHYGLLEGLTQRGATLSGPSPFHDGQPTLRVHVERQVWNDMSGRPDGDNGRPVAGNAIGLIQALERCSFRRALEIASERFAQAENKRAEVAAVLRDEATSEELAPPFGKELRGLRHDIPFLADLGISPKTAKAYGVGAGIRGMMKGLLACPVRSVDGEIQGYVGRRLQRPDPEVPLWRNPPGIPIGKHLFGLFRALSTKTGRKAIADYGLIVVQSPVDVLKLAEARFLNAVALMGPQTYAGQRALLTDPGVNPTRRVTLAHDRSPVGAEGRRADARELIHTAFIRYAVWEAVGGSVSSPAQLSREELREVLALR